MSKRIGKKSEEKKPSKMRFIGMKLAKQDVWQEIGRIDEVVLKRY